MPGLTEIKLGWLVIRATFGVLFLLFLTTLVLAVLGVEPLTTLYGVKGTFNDPRPLATWYLAQQAAGMAWLTSHPLVTMGILPIVLLLAWVLPNPNTKEAL